jgi:hypothetical protein
LDFLKWVVHYTACLLIGTLLITKQTAGEKEEEESKVEI